MNYSVYLLERKFLNSSYSSTNFGIVNIIKPMLKSKNSLLLLLSRIRNKVSKNKKISINEIKNIKPIQFENLETKSLHKSIRNLEFINQLEMHFQESSIKKMPLEFFQELKQLKKNSEYQLLTSLHSINTI